MRSNVIMKTTLARGMVRNLALLVMVSTVSAALAEQPPDLHKQLKDPAPSVRAKAAVELAEANDVEAIPVLIDLLADLPSEQRQPIEELLTKLAGEWAPMPRLGSDDSLGRKILRDAWMAWWRNTNGPALVALVREHTLTPEMRQKIKQIITKLGDSEYLTREAATDELLALGRITLPQLREAIHSLDREVGRRARQVVLRLEQEPARSLPTVAVRLLALRKPEGAVEALLAYLPFAEEDNRHSEVNRIEEVKKALTALARRDGKLDANLVRALSDEQPQLRAIAVEALVQGGGSDGRAAVRKLLKDKVPSVRLRVAFALVLAGERSSIPVLIDLLSLVTDEQTGEIESVLHQLAGELAPETSWGLEEGDKKKCRDAWAAWWKANGSSVDLTRLKVQPLYGYTLLCDSSRNCVYEIDRDGKVRWSIDGVPFPVDAWVVGGNRVLIAEYSGRKISERDLKGKVIWSKPVNNLPVNVQRLPSGNTFIATLNQLLEVDRSGKEVYAINNVAGGVTAAYRALDGRIICLAQQGGLCIIMDTTGKLLKQFPSNRNAGWTSGIDLLANGHILITQPNRNKVAEYDRDGKLILEVDALNVTTATGMPNGHILVASSGTRRAFELDRAGKVVWEHKGNGNIFRARRR
jgi:HEAT repeat protein